MIGSVKINNLGPLERVDWAPGPGFNVIIGANDSGKTLLLKALYATVRSTEEYGRGNDARTFKQVLDDKLTWTFQLPVLGDIVRRSDDRSGCSVALDIDGRAVDFRLTAKARKGVGEARTELGQRSGTSIFIPAKEVLSMVGVIKESRHQQKFGFDDPTYDLVRALEAEPSRGKPPFGDARKALERLIGGRLREESHKGWVFERGRSKYPVAITAEGIKKVAIIDRLIVNRTLSSNSILFIDEPESFLHPEAAIKLLEILGHLVRSGVQVVMATHSQFILSKLAIMARRMKTSTPLLSLPASGQGDPSGADLLEGIPDNAITEASINLYQEELDTELDDEG
jgi:energy-coupling factor transporter ATP-binding protein EcfA2